MGTMSFEMGSAFGAHRPRAEGILERGIEVYDSRAPHRRFTARDFTFVRA